MRGVESIDWTLLPVGVRMTTREAAGRMGCLVGTLRVRLAPATRARIPPNILVERVQGDGGKTASVMLTRTA